MYLDNELSQTIDSEFLALQLMSKNGSVGTSYVAFVTRDVALMRSALILISKGYASRRLVGLEDCNYCITPSGKEYLSSLSGCKNSMAYSLNGNYLLPSLK